MSRPELPIDWKLVDRLLKCGSPGTEIAAHFSMHPNTFYNRVEQKYNMSFSEYSQEKRSIGDALIRAAQFDKALTGDNGMLIWLGKHRLDQKEEVVNRNIPHEEVKVMISNIKEAHEEVSVQPQAANEPKGSDGPH